MEAIERTLASGGSAIIGEDVVNAARDMELIVMIQS